MSTPRDQDRILNDLGYDEYQPGESEGEPDPGSRFQGVHDSQQGGGNHGDDLEVGDHVQQPAEQTEQDAEGQPDDGKTGGQEDAGEKRHRGLSAKILLHADFEVVEK